MVEAGQIQAMMRIQKKPGVPAVPEVERDLDWQVAESTGEQTRVLLHNDDVTPFDFVILVLTVVFEFGLRDAERITAQAHHNGIAYVTTLPFEEAKYRVGQAHGMARSAGYPLTLSIEAE